MRDSPRPFRLGPWRVEPAANRLVGERGSGRLEPKVMDLLVALAEHPREVLSRERLLDAVWPDVHVSDEALTTAVYQLRRALGDDARSPRFLETVPKRGYRLVAAVEPARPVGPAAPVRAPTGRIRRAALAAGLLLVAVWVGPLPRPPSVAERADALHQRALDRANGAWDFRGAEADLRLALALDPGHSRSHELMAQLHFIAGRRGEAIDALERARRAAPESASAHRVSGLILAGLGEPAAAEAHYRRALALDPGDRIAADGLAKLLDPRTDAEPEAGAGRVGVVDRVAETARRASLTPFDVAGLYAEVGAADRAFDWLDRAWSERDPGLFFLRYDTRWEPYRDDPRVLALLERLEAAVPVS